MLVKSRRDSKQRFKKRLNYQVSDFRGVDLSELFEHDYFVFNTPVSNYVCTIAFPGVLTQLKEVVKVTNGDPKRINLQLVIKALRQAFDKTDDIKVNCTCGDWTYRLAYWATVHGYKYGPPEDRPSNKTNPDDNLGATCKHLNVFLSNKRWLTKAASVVNSLIKTYPDKAAVYLYDEDEIKKTDDDDIEDEIVDDKVNEEPSEEAPKEVSQDDEGDEISTEEDSSENKSEEDTQ